jgi:hypothetical protein
MSAKETLQMIETVSPDDTAKLDVIDARVWCWLNGKNFYKDGNLNCWWDESRVSPWQARWLVEYLEDENWRYTRSRDALKAIRPEGWQFCVTNYDDGQAEIITYHAGELVGEIGQKWLPTEELAELHAIIQAIEYERNNPPTVSND